MNAISAVVLKHELDDNDLSMAEISALAMAMEAKNPTAMKGG